ncbi:phosphohydrolase [Methylobacterium nigriterrae]|uniref:phosphohydrolase n=1 Tax=Methylobacterium nigriterrae TaxID=3127512 RepID=UPI0030136132
MTSADAKAFARLHHVGQGDQAGQPVFDRLARVACAVERRAQHAADTGLPVRSDEITQAAWLHDVIEDTSLTANELRTAGFAESVVTMVELLTKPKGQETDEARIAKLTASGNLGAILIKPSENEDAVSPDRSLDPASTLAARDAATMVRLRKAAAALGYSGP